MSPGYATYQSWKHVDPWGSEMNCTRCGKEILVGVAFCTECGNPVPQALEPDPNQTAGPVAEPDDDSGEPTRRERPGVDRDQHVIGATCAACGEKLSGRNAFCTGCGAPVSREAAVPSEPEPLEPNLGPACSSCGSPLAPGVAFCTECGTVAPSEAATEAMPGQAPKLDDVPAETPTTRALTFGTEDEAGESAVMTPEDESVAEAATPAPIASDRSHIPPATLEPVGAIAESPAAFCTTCGSRLEPGDDSCLKCNAPRHRDPESDSEGETTVAAVPATEVIEAEQTPVEAPAVDTQGQRERPLSPLWVLLAVAVLVSAGWLVSRGLSGDEGPGIASDAAATTATTQAGGSTTMAAAATNTGGTEGGTDPGSTGVGTDPGNAETGAEACQMIADGAVDATKALTDAFAGESVADLVELARAGRQSMPGASEFDAANAALVEANDGCSPSGNEALYVAGMARVVPPADPAARIAHAAGAYLWGFDDADLLTRVTAALRLYPDHGTVQVDPTPADGLPKWTVILESLDVADFTQADATVNAAAYTDRSIETGVFLSDDYGSLNGGYWVVYTGMFDSRDEASSLCSAIRSRVEYCYDRYLQQLPTTTGSNGACGPYGRYDVVGIPSGGVLDVRLGPASGQQVLGAYASNATAILAAGPPIVVGSTTWAPVEINGKIGWAESRFLRVESACEGSTPSGSTTESCPAIAVATADLFKAIVSAAATADVSGTTAVSSIDVSGFDATAAALVADAGSSGCDVAQLNSLVAAQHGAIKADGEFAELVLGILTSQPFFVEAPM